MISHHNQSLELCEKSVECLTISVHLASDKPKPDNAPYRPAIVWQKQVNMRNPTQLNRKLTKNAVTNTMSVPKSPLSVLISLSPDSMAMKAISLWLGIGALIEWWIGGGGGGFSICGIVNSSFRIFSICTSSYDGNFPWALLTPFSAIGEVELSGAGYSQLLSKRAAQLNQALVAGSRDY